jgi:hypothetical protein
MEVSRELAPMRIPLEATRNEAREGMVKIQTARHGVQDLQTCVRLLLSEGKTRPSQRRLPNKSFQHAAKYFWHRY